MKLLNPKVHSQSRKWCTEKQMFAILKKLKQKKYGFKDYAVEVEEVEIKQTTQIPYHLKTTTLNANIGRKCLGQAEGAVMLTPGTYFHVYVEYIV